MSGKRTLYVGGLDENVDEKTLQSAFIPFGDIVEVQIPLDQATQKNRGFGFVEFELAEDASAALDNMHNAELYGRVLKCNLAKPQQGPRNKPVWAEDSWHEDRDKEKEDGKEEEDSTEKLEEKTEEVEPETEGEPEKQEDQQT
eukprot:TRINITY_DN3574_c0_g1_i1.p1 TRINITY_DN3574_c0_g1~~TRINITY_DN3574_c0_g1_i1.p1  ORF type:complete len:143 (-),score=44.93 TRINITY_DN3574_c0_g1_i1:50-478(-)